MGQLVPGKDSGWRQTLYVALLFPIRGVFLWLIYPATFLVWLLLLPVRAIRRFVRGHRHPTFRQYVTWVDIVFIVLLNRTLLLPLGGAREWPKWPAHGEEGPRTSFLDAI
jgi:hypothetical protein